MEGFQTFCGSASLTLAGYEAAKQSQRPGTRRPAGRGVRGPCAYETMKPTSESLSHQGRHSLMVAECNCMTARECGEQHEAKDQPQKLKDLNTIPPVKLTSRLRGEIGAKARVSDEVLGEKPCSRPLQQVSKRSGQRGCRVFGGGMVGRSATSVAKDAEAEVATLERLLREGKYEPQPVKRVWIPKPGSRDKRPLGICFGPPHGPHPYGAACVWLPRPSVPRHEAG